MKVESLIQDTEKVYTMRISTRGAAVREVIPSTTYQVNLPSQLTGKPGRCEFLSGGIVLNTGASDYVKLAEVGIICSLNQQGYNAETEFGGNQFTPCPNTILFNCNMAVYNDKSSLLRHPAENTPYSFRVGSIPERLTFSTYAQIESVVTAGSFVALEWYKIVSLGNTDFTLIGASSNNVGVIYNSTGVGTGTGTALLLNTAVENLYANPYLATFVLRFHLE